MRYRSSYVDHQRRRPQDRAFPFHHSKYLNGGNVREENRLAIDAAIEELDYSVNVFARSLKANRSMTIGVLLPTISSPFFGARRGGDGACAAPQRLRVLRLQLRF